MKNVVMTSVISLALLSSPLAAGKEDTPVAGGGGPRF